MQKPILTVFTVLLFSSLFSGTAPADVDDPSWITLEQKKYGFEVMLPEQPEEVMTRKNYHVGEVVNHIYTAHDNEQVFKVDFSELPGLAVRFLGEDAILDQTRNGILQKEFGKQVSYKNTTLGKHKGKKLIYHTPATDDHPGMKGEAKFFLKGHKLYMAESITPKSQLPGNAKKFFDSFKLD